MNFSWQSRGPRGTTAGLLAALALGASARAQPATTSAAGEALTPVVVIPGTSGIELREPGSGKVRWGNGRSLFLPRDRGHSLALPIDPRPGARAGLEPGGPILCIRLGPYRRPFYAPVLRLLEDAGYVYGDLNDPRPDATLFFFSYDWRVDQVTNARELARRLENLRRARQLDSLTVRVIAQSSGAHLARYFIKYGGASLDAAERGQTHPPAHVDVDQLILVGNSNGGALRVLRDLNRGRRYVFLGRRFSPEVLFTFRSLFYDLPVYTEGLFIDEAGQPLKIDLFDEDNWREYQWSIYQPSVAARLARADGALGNPASRARYLEAQLRDARRFHRLLQADIAGFGATRYYSLQNVSDRTPARALVTRRRGRWRTAFAGDRVADTPRLRALTGGSGDGHATLESQQRLSAQELLAFALPPRYFKGGHFEVILNPELQAQLVAILRD